MVTPAGVSRRLAIFTRRVCCHREQRQSACIIYKHRRDDSDRIQPAGQGNFQHPAIYGYAGREYGGFALPVTFSMPETPVAVEALPENTLLQERLTTLARSMQLKMDWQEVSNSFTDEDGNTIQPPWKEYDLQILTTLPAHQVAEHFSEPSVRFISVTRQLEEGRFRYQFTGKYYVQ